MATIQGGSGADTLLGTGEADTIYGGAGDDTLRGAGGNDLLFGEEGRDELYGGAGDDVLDAGPGGAALQVVYGEGGDDIYLYRREMGGLFTFNAVGADLGSDEIRFSDLTLREMTFSLYDYRATPYPALGLALQLNWTDASVSHGEFRIAGDATPISRIVFADGSTVSRISVDENNPDAVTFHGTGVGDRIATSFQDDTIHGAAGDDWLHAGGTRGGEQYLSGGSGDDTYVYARESGTTIIDEAAEAALSGQDRVVMSDLDIEAVVPELVAGSGTADRLSLTWDNSAEAGGRAQGILANASEALAQIFGPPPLEPAASAEAAQSTFPTVAAASLGTPVGDTLRVNAFAKEGDGGGALYRRVETEPDHPGKFQSANGLWWELSEPAVRPEMFGARSDDGQDDLPGLRSAAETAYATGAVFAGANGAIYEVSASWDIERPLILTGSWTVRTLPSFESTVVEGRAAQRVVGLYASDIVQLDPLSRITVDATHMSDPTETWFSDQSAEYNPDEFLYVAVHGEQVHRLDLSISVMNSPGGGVYISDSNNATLRNVYAENVQTVNTADMAPADLLAVAPVFGFHNSTGGRIIGGYIADSTDKGFSFKESSDMVGQDLWAVGGHIGHASHYTNRVDGALFVGGGHIGGATNGHGAKIYDSDNVVVRGMEFLGVSIGVSVEHSANVLVEDNLVVDPAQYGVLVYSLIPEKFIQDGATGLIHTHTDNVLVRGNTISVPLLWHAAGDTAREIASYTWGDPTNGYTRDLVIENNEISIHGAGSLSIADRGQNIERFEIGGRIFDSIGVARPEDLALTGGAGADWLYAVGGSQSLEGGAGDDLLHGGTGADILIGGEGVDTADYANGYGAIRIDLTAGRGWWNSADGDVLSGIEGVAGTAFGDVLSGSAGVNTLLGRGGDDLMSGRMGADHLDGGAGRDTASYAGDYGAVFVSLISGQGRWNAAQGDILQSIENLIGTGYDDVLVGDDQDNRLEGGAGADYLYGMGGSNILVGGSGSDWLYGGSGKNTGDYSGAYGAVWIDLAAGVGRWNHAEGDILASIDDLIGTAWDDHLNGDGGANRLEGGVGDDILVGGGGSDVLVGGLGLDKLDGGTGVDTADYSEAYGAVWVDLATGAGRWNYADGDTLSGIENVVGTSYGDRIAGNSVNNVLTGGAGADAFFLGAGFGHDVISDFDGDGANAGDIVGFAPGLFADFADLMSHAVQQGGDVVITCGSNTLTLTGVQRSSLHANDFDFNAATASAPEADAFFIPGEMASPHVTPTFDDGAAALGAGLAKHPVFSLKVLDDTKLWIVDPGSELDQRSEDWWM